MSKKQLTIIYVAIKEELYKESYYRRLWTVARNIKLSRREWLDEISLAIFKFQGQILYPNGTPYEVPDLDEAFGDDPDARWLSYYFKADQTGFEPRAFSRKYLRVQLIDLYVKIKYPKMAKIIAK